MSNQPIEQPDANLSDATVSHTNVSDTSASEASASDASVSLFDAPSQPRTGYPYTPYQPLFDRPRRALTFGTPDVPAPWIAWLLGFLFLRYVLWYTDGIVTTGFFWLLFAGCACYTRACGFRQTASHRLQGGILCVFAASFTLTASPLLHGLCALFLLAATAWWMYAVCNGHPHIPRFFAFSLGKVVLDYPFSNPSVATQAISHAIRKSKTAKSFRIVLIGVLVTIPMTAVVAALLAEADPGIAKLFRGIGRLLTDTVWQTAFQLLFGFLAGTGFYSAAYAAAHPQLRPEPTEAQYEERLAGLRVVPNLGLYAAVTPICLLYLLYVISQLGYFLSAFFGQLPETMTYAAYARRGFFELCAIAVINLIVTLVLSGCAKEGGASKPRTLKGYCIALCSFTLFIIATAIAKMFLYIDAYGLTRLRLYTAWFMVLLAVCFLLLLVRQCVRQMPTARILVTTFVALFAILCFARPDALIASYNLARYEAGTLNELDVEMLCTLSDDAYVVMAEHWDTISQTSDAKTFENALAVRCRTYETEPDTAWNLSAWRLQSCKAIASDS